MCDGDEDDVMVMMTSVCMCHRAWDMACCKSSCYVVGQQCLCDPTDLCVFMCDDDDADNDDDKNFDECVYCDDDDAA